MDTWPILIGVAVALTGALYWGSRPLPDNARDGEYRRHLTKTEKATLRKGETLEKIHKAYQTVWRDYYDEGPLRVAIDANGKYKFNPHGQWKRLTTKGRLIAESNQDNSYSKGYWREYWPDGSVQYYWYAVPMVVNGDSVNYNRWVYFAPGNSRDTAWVQHSFWYVERSKRGKDAIPTFFSFDAQGRKRVPPGWKPSF